MINLDPAAEASSSGQAPPAAVCITDLISLENICREEKLGPNGGACCSNFMMRAETRAHFVCVHISAHERVLVWTDEVSMVVNYVRAPGLLFAMDFLWANIDWLEEQLEQLIRAGDAYFVFDFPGQMELFTLSDATRNIIETINTKWRIRLAAVQMLDSHLCMDASKCVSIPIHVSFSICERGERSARNCFYTCAYTRV